MRHFSESALLTDLCQITMLQGYFARGMAAPLAEIRVYAWPRSAAMPAALRSLAPAAPPEGAVQALAEADRVQWSGH